MYYLKERNEGAEDVHKEGSGHQKKRHRSSKTRLVRLLGAILTIETALLLAAYVRMSVAEKENIELVAAERKQAEELEILRPQVEKLREDIAAMTEARLPNLRRLEFDQVLSIDQGYVKNVVFSIAGKGDQKHYEYKLVIHNGGLNLVHLRVDILLFDRVGIQVGQARIGVQKDGTHTLDMLDRGEIRSYSSNIELTDRTQPEYFRLRILE